MYLVASLIVAFVTAAVEWFIKHDTYTAISFVLVIPLLLLVPRLLYRIGTVKRAWLVYVEKLVFIMVVLNAIGTGYFHTQAPQYQYDRLLHLGAAFIGVLLIITFWIMLSGQLKNTRRTLWGALIIGGIGLFVWEGWQYFSDQVFRSRSFFDYTQAITRDFWEDIIFGFLGLLLAVPYARHMMPRFRRFLRSS